MNRSSRVSAPPFRAAANYYGYTPDKPYRVRIGRLTSRTDAVALAAKLTGQGTTAIVVEAEP